MSACNRHCLQQLCEVAGVHTQQISSASQQKSYYSLSTTGNSRFSHGVRGLLTPPKLPPPGRPSWDLSREAVARHECGMRCLTLGGLRDHEPKAEREMKQALFPQPDRLEHIKPSFYLCDQSAVQLMVKAVTGDWPCPLGTWVRQELDAGDLWSCKAVEAVYGWKVCTPAPRGADYGTREAVLRLLATLRTEFPLVTVTVDESVMFDTIQTYAWAESTIDW